MTDVMVGFILLTLRVYLIYLLTTGWYYIKSVGIKLWLWLYSIGVATYLAYSSLSTLSMDSEDPVRIAGVAGLVLCTQILVKTLKKYIVKEN